MADGRERVRRWTHLYVIAALYAVWAAMCIALALDLGPHLPDALRIGFAAFAAPFLPLIVRTVMAGVYVGPDGVLIRNVLSSRRLRWADIERFELGEFRGFGGFACGVARLKDGGQVTIFALNPPAMGEDVVLPHLDKLNTRLGAATGRTLAPATV